MLKNHLSSIFYILLILLIQIQTIDVVKAQNDIRIGQWRSHLPYQFGRYITQSEASVFYTTDFAVLEIDKQERSVRFLSKVDGLSDVGTELVKYSPTNDALLLTYSNSAFDLIKPDEVVTFVNIRDDGNFFNRTINDVAIFKDSIAYFSTGFGVVEFNLRSEVFGFTANFGINVYSTALYNGFLYASSEDGIYRAQDDPNINLKDLNNWQLLDVADGFPAVYQTNALQAYSGKLYLDLNDTLFTYDGQGLTKIQYEEGFEIRYMTAESSNLLVGYFCLDNCTGKVHIFDSAGNYEVTGSGTACTDRPLYAIEDQFGQFWFADQFRDVRTNSVPGDNCEKLQFNSPFDERATEIVIDDNKVYVATEPTLVVPDLSPSGFYEFSDGQWSIFNRRTEADLNGMLAFYRIAVHPENKKVYVGTFWDGLVELDGESITVYREEGTKLQPSVLDDFVIRVSGLAFDRDNNLWMANHTAQNPIVVFRNDGTWKNDFPGVPPVGAFRQLVIDRDGNKWFTVDGDNQGIYVFNEGVMDDPSDDQRRVLTVSNTVLPNNRVNCLAVDLDGDVWAGTTEGPVVFECGSSVFDPNCTGSKRIVDVGGFAAFLLEDENILTIAVDGANRKWFGTENGVFVQSASGEEQVAFFNTDNSPLFDNIINDIAINPNDGEAFIGTLKGLISYRSEAIEGGIINSSEVYAFPNPVRPDYNGPIAIKGLARDANVKITDINGQLVFETTALGGQAIWDGRDYNGRKAATGVYLVFSTSTRNRDNPDTAVTKILFMN